MRNFLTLAALVVACTALFHCARVFPTSCDVAEDCNGSDEAKSAGRCAPELACVEGRCRAECLGHCKASMVGSRFPTPLCDNGGICSAPAPTPPADDAEGRCTRRPIRCASAADCPLFEPHAGEWTCENGTCAFPGFAYEYP